MKYVRSISRGTKHTNEETVSQKLANANVDMNSQWALHGCPKCNGDLYLEIDEDGDSICHCLQCGFASMMKPLAIG